MFYYPNALPPYAAVKERTEAEKMGDLLTEVDGLIDVLWQEWFGHHRGFAGLWDSNEASDFASQVRGVTVRLKMEMAKLCPVKADQGAVGNGPVEQMPVL